jgi:hypothetical protein
MARKKTNPVMIPLVTVVAILGIVAAYYIFANDSSSQIQPKNNGQNNEVTNSPISSEPKKKSDIELIKEFADTLLRTGKDAMRAKRIKDSMELATRDEKFAYQIGFPIDDKERVFEAVEALEGIENISVFRVSNEEYYLIRFDPTKTETNLKDSLVAFENEINKLRSGSEISVINLMKFCPRKKQLEEDTPLKRRKKRKKEELVIRCLFCD